MLTLAALTLAAVAALAGQASQDASVTVAVLDVTTVPARNGLRMQVYALPYRGVDVRESVLIGLELEGFARTGSRRLQVSYALLDRDGLHAERTVAVPLTDATAAQAADEGVRVLTRLDVPSGTFDLRVTVEDMAEGRTITGTHRLEVPPYAFMGDAIGLSGVMLTSTGVDGVTHADPEEEHRMLPILLQPPAALREFSRNELVEVGVEIYTKDFEFDIGSQMSVFTRVFDAAGTMVYDTSDLATSETLTNGGWGYVHFALVPVRDLTPGDYVLQVGVTGFDTVPSTWRSVPFRVR